MKSSSGSSMARKHQVTVNGKTFVAREGELLLDAALKNGVDLPYDCRAGHCGTCCVNLVSGDVEGGEGAEPGVVHACQCRIAGDVVVERGAAPTVREVGGVLTTLRPLSAEVLEAGITTERALPYLPGQYVQVRFNGYPSRPFSITHALRGPAHSRSVFFHIRRMAGGRVTPALGTRIKTGHRVTLAGPFGAAYFRPQTDGRLILVGTNTGFAPIWSIAAAALRENPERSVMVIAGGRGLQALYMGPALSQLARFPNVRIVPVCSRTQNLPPVVMPGRPTDYLPPLLASDQVYACGSAAMVDQVKAIAASAGAVCYADPFLPSKSEAAEEGLITRAMGWLTLPSGLQTRRGHGDSRGQTRREPAMPVYEMAEARVKRHLGS